MGEKYNEPGAGTSTAPGGTSMDDRLKQVIELLSEPGAGTGTPPDGTSMADRYEQAIEILSQPGAAPLYGGLRPLPSAGTSTPADSVPSPHPEGSPEEKPGSDPPQPRKPPH